MAVDGVGMYYGGSWPMTLGSTANDRTAPISLSGGRQVRWRVDLPYEGVTGLCVGADGTCYVSGSGGVTALNKRGTKWSVDADAATTVLLLLDNGLLVTTEADNFVVREQYTGAPVSTIAASWFSWPTLLSNGLLAFVDGRYGARRLCAADLTGQRRWERPLADPLSPPLVHSDHVIIADDVTVRAFDNDGTPRWTRALDKTILPEISAVPAEPDADPDLGKVSSPLMRLPSGRILVGFEADDRHGFLVVDPQLDEVKALPAHLPLGMVAPLRNQLDQDLIVLQGWPEKDEYGQHHPTLTAVNVDTGTTLPFHMVAAEPRSMVAGSSGLVAVAGGPSEDRWTKYRWAADFYPIADWYYVLLLDASGVRWDWRPGKPVTGPLAVGPAGDLIVPILGELVSLG